MFLCTWNLILASGRSFANGRDVRKNGFESETGEVITITLRPGLEGGLGGYYMNPPTGERHKYADITAETEIYIPCLWATR